MASSIKKSNHLQEIMFQRFLLLLLDCHRHLSALQLHLSRHSSRFTFLPSLLITIPDYNYDTVYHASLRLIADVNTEVVQRKCILSQRKISHNNSPSCPVTPHNSTRPLLVIHVATRSGSTTMLI